MSVISTACFLRLCTNNNEVISLNLEVTGEIHNTAVGGGAFQLADLTLRVQVLSRISDVCVCVTWQVYKVLINESSHD